jgi:ribosome-associated heat shock protein Hsp15
VKTSKDQPADSLRIDKWLWAARFYKTRGLAAEAIDAGKVAINAIRAKPAKAVRVGDKLTIRRSPYVYELTVRAISARRGPASEAAQLYQESAESQQAREALSAQLKLGAIDRPIGRPSKRARRQIIRFTRKDAE